jgi:hypothetical protein
MRMPNGDKAVIDPRKIVDYCLSAQHDEGKHKAFLFATLLGIDQSNSGRLIAALRQAAREANAPPERTDKYGTRYAIDFTMSGPRGSAMVRSAWIIRAGEDVPRFVTCYIL